MATLADTGFAEGGTKAQVFVVESVDGNRVDNSIRASARASQGQGFSLSTRYVERRVPVRPMKVGLRGTHITGAPIQALIGQLAGSVRAVDGTVDFSPKAGNRYVVKGELSRDGSSVWIEDAGTGEIVTTKVTGK